MSPLQVWLDELGLTHGQFALAAGVSRCQIQAVVAGQYRMGETLRKYLDSLRADIAQDHDAWFDVHQKEMKRKVAEAAA